MGRLEGHGERAQGGLRASRREGGHGVGNLCEADEEGQALPRRGVLSGLLPCVQTIAHGPLPDECHGVAASCDLRCMWWRCLQSRPCLLYVFSASGSTPLSVSQDLVGSPPKASARVGLEWL